MAGQMGAVRRTAQNLEVVSTDVERGLILIRGGVPGPESGFVFVSDAVKRDFPKDAPFPASLSGAGSDEGESAEEARLQLAALQERLQGELAMRQHAQGRQAELRERKATRSVSPTLALK